MASSAFDGSSTCIRSGRDWIRGALPLAIVWQNRRPALLLEETGGTVLEERLDRPLELPVALSVGIRIASAIGRFHALGFTDRNLNPINVFIDFRTERRGLVGRIFSATFGERGGIDANSRFHRFFHWVDDGFLNFVVFIHEIIHMPYYQSIQSVEILSDQLVDVFIFGVCNKREKLTCNEVASAFRLWF